VRALLSALKHNQLIGILPDQDPGKTGGVFAPFFGKPANTIVLVGRLLKRNQSPVLFTVCERLSWGRGYRVHILPASKQIHDPDDILTASALNQGVEACISLEPSQYVWNYKRWKRQENGEKVY
jgi:KDO2-lipid IV(A) lauroyltransferase